MISESKNGNSKLAQYLRKDEDHGSFPNPDINYFERFVQIDNWLNKEIHPHVNQGATAIDSIWLTDHGPDHIATVIRRISDLVFPQCVLTPYEAYILLIASHFHDIGNVFGRDGHEKKCREIMFDLDSSLVGTDTAEKRIICDIATAHGGYVDEAGSNKDTIGSLPYPQYRTGAEKLVRVRMLAAILRFADELADDYTRTSRFVMEQTTNLYPGSEIYHAYANQLKSVHINTTEESILISFELSTDVVAKKYKKSQNTSRYLIEEIKDRTLKMHREHVYCTRFMLPAVHIERIYIRILVCSQNYSQEIGKIEYTMVPQGYPDKPSGLTDICPEIGKLSGTMLDKRVKKLARRQNANSSKSYNLLLDESQWET